MKNISSHSRFSFFEFNFVKLSLDISVFFRRLKKKDSKEDADHERGVQTEFTAQLLLSQCTLLHKPGSFLSSFAVRTSGFDNRRSSLSLSMFFLNASPPRSILFCLGSSSQSGGGGGRTARARRRRDPGPRRAALLCSPSYR